MLCMLCQMWWPAPVWRPWGHARVCGNAVLSPSLLQRNMQAGVQAPCLSLHHLLPIFPQSCWGARSSLMWPTLAHQQPPRLSSRWRAAGSACPTPTLMWSWWRLWVRLLASRNLAGLWSDPQCWWLRRHPWQASAGGNCPSSSVAALPPHAWEGAPAVFVGDWPDEENPYPQADIIPRPPS